MQSRLPTLAALVLCTLVLTGVAQAEETPTFDEWPTERVLYVAPGQTLSGLVQKAYPDQRDRWNEIQGWIVDHNPHAFIDGDPSRLRGNVRLRLPHASKAATGQSRAVAERTEDSDLVFDGRYLFVNPAQTLSDLVPRVYPEQSEYWDSIIESIIVRNERALRDRDRAWSIARGTRLSIPNLVARTEPGAEVAMEPVVGAVQSISGGVQAIGSDGLRRDLGEDSPVRRGDTISTVDGATVRIELNDGEELRLQPDSRIRIREWSLPEVGPGQRVIGLLAGGLRAITGALGNRAQDDYRTITPAATMGIRGTDYSLQLCDSGACTDASGETLPAGLYVGVAEGEIELLNAGGEEVYAAGEYGYVASAEVAPEQIEARSAPTSVAVEPVAGDDDSGGNRGWLLGLGALLLLAL